MHMLLKHRRIVEESQMELRWEVLELLVLFDERNFHGWRVQTQAIVEVNAARRSSCLDAFERQVHAARLCLDLGGSNIADDFRDDWAVGE